MQRALGQKREPSRGEEVLPKVSCGHFEVCLVVLRVRLIEDHRKREGIIRDPPPLHNRLLPSCLTCAKFCPIQFRGPSENGK